MTTTTTTTTTTLFVRDESNTRVRYRPATPDELRQAAVEQLIKPLMSRNSFLSPHDTRAFLKIWFAGLEHEVFTALWLTNRHHLISAENLFRGTIDGASVYPREVAKAALKVNAAAVIFAHNHPSGIAEPSRADINITQRLKEALGLFEIKVLDHLIVGADEITSLAERGQI